MKYTNPLDFNDPFDCYPTWDKSAVKRAVAGNRQKYRRGLDQRISADAGGEKLSPAKKLVRRNQYSNSAQNLIGSPEWRDQLLASVGVVSLSLNPFNILMWSHYANNHKGFLVGFKVPLFGAREDVENYSRNLVPHEVRYQTSRPVIKMGQESRMGHLERLLMTKSEDWRYEQEHRVIDVERGAGIHEYNRDEVLDVVVAGMKMRGSELQELRMAVDHLKQNPALADLSLYQAKMSDTEYAIDIPKFPVKKEDIPPP